MSEYGVGARVLRARCSSSAMVGEERVMVLKVRFELGWIVGTEEGIGYVNDRPLSPYGVGDSHSHGATFVRWW